MIKKCRAIGGCVFVTLTTTEVLALFYSHNLIYRRWEVLLTIAILVISFNAGLWWFASKENGAETYYKLEEKSSS